MVTERLFVIQAYYITSDLFGEEDRDFFGKIITDYSEYHPIDHMTVAVALRETWVDGKEDIIREVA